MLAWEVKAKQSVKYEDGMEGFGHVRALRFLYKELKVKRPPTTMKRYSTGASMDVAMAVGARRAL